MYISDTSIVQQLFSVCPCPSACLIVWIWNNVLTIDYQYQGVIWIKFNHTIFKNHWCLFSKESIFSVLSKMEKSNAKNWGNINLIRKNQYQNIFTIKPSFQYGKKTSDKHDILNSKQSDWMWCVWLLSTVSIVT